MDRIKMVKAISIFLVLFLLSVVMIYVLSFLGYSTENVFKTAGFMAIMTMIVLTVFTKKY